ncbi:Predicted metal-binding protein related to the C-terminal domain of SecA [Leclercia adecarboxylata]|uniref:Predicted metal-binding protein related to the C-terminal domain of SecA n=1 Tax=Leclercia adecarboxylata TaxID=83655 RepID=A0A4U9I440_9ENTR|nr:Predicted metal-binding protein related to the C-terminal domain of SecA [Leclercia adecarboxylata]
MPIWILLPLHGSEENFERLDTFSEEEFQQSIENIRPAALRLYNYWIANPQATVTQQPVINGTKVGRNDPCPCGSGKKFKNCCLH